jgi:hypothetical protein
LVASHRQKRTTEWSSPRYFAGNPLQETADDENDDDDDEDDAERKMASQLMLGAS